MSSKCMHGSGVVVTTYLELPLQNFTYSNTPIYVSKTTNPTLYKLVTAAWCDHSSTAVNNATTGTPSKGHSTCFAFVSLLLECCVLDCCV